MENLNQKDFEYLKSLLFKIFNEEDRYLRYEIYLRCINELSLMKMTNQKQSTLSQEIRDLLEELNNEDHYFNQISIYRKIYSVLDQIEEKYEKITYANLLE